MNAVTKQHNAERSGIDEGWIFSNGRPGTEANKLLIGSTGQIPRPGSAGEGSIFGR